jgi:hypothetical protein
MGSRVFSSYPDTKNDKFYLSFLSMGVLARQWETLAFTNMITTSDFLRVDQYCQLASWVFYIFLHSG